MLRDQTETALSDLLQATHQVTHAYRTAAELLAECDEAKVFAELAEAAEKASLDLDVALQEAGMPPPAPDVELAFFRSLLARGEALLRGNERQTIIEHCQALESAILSGAELANSLGLSDRLSQCVRMQVTRARKSLKLLGPIGSAYHEQ